MSQLDLDPQFMQGLRLLHSPNKDSAEQLRSLLDDAIRQKHGPAKMLCNVLHKKYTMEEPVLSDHSSGSSKKSKGSTTSSKHSSKSSKNSSPINLPSHDTPPDIIQTDDTFALEILEDDLTCVICKGMDVGARNRLVECVECHSLYHQECHTPHILDTQIDDPRLVWYCSSCSKSQQASKDRSSPRTIAEGKSKDHKKSSGSTLKHSDKYKSTSGNATSSQSNSGGSTPTGASSAPKLTPNINIVSGDRRLRDMMKKVKQEKRSNSSGSSKHSSSNALLSSSKTAQDKSLLFKIKSGSE
ncbi:integrator complex subunit 12-like [Neodiprion virginianus]|uniref:integrator complex subunit 12-like n=1 Tax=Neodiprion virginianus TaxID=2961670 RepID=UPI001EE6BEE4|nr:integrator complex subunit 12-like [Neodiprion virginianus]XP_046623284.1 integrator complex subunit 12-like [Neodiprion virginianus]XP_046623285.1 integrator complex subunit 12-like [Neodiprion virginianus]XP_046623286.1 integrator complex subunit 12-like [Neodiprion virginianus]XP_046623287.1 integrator complex subunit 12-like [Neodiprion virginianus]XP_046623288.1 integrator complex subunit 12-like [Neodiprion virginianus]